MVTEFFWQIYLLKENHTGSLIEGTLLAIGGRYDYMLHQMWEHEYVSSTAAITPLLLVIFISLDTFTKPIFGLP